MIRPEVEVNKQEMGELMLEPTDGAEKALTTKERGERVRGWGKREGGLPTKKDRGRTERECLGKKRKGIGQKEKKLGKLTFARGTRYYRVFRLLEKDVPSRDYTEK